MIEYWVILIFYILIGIYDLYLYAIAKTLTITQRIHRSIYSYRTLRIVATFILLPFSWYTGGIQLFLSVLTGWLICHLIGWDF
jgi:hypothetical protein